MSTGTCAGCGAAIDASTATYSEEGQLICKACEAKQTIRTGDKRATDAIYGAALAALGLGLASFACNPGMLLSIAAIGTGSSALFALMRHPEYRKTLGDTKWTLAWICAPLGLLLGCVVPGLLLLTFLLAAAS